MESIIPILIAAAAGYAVSILTWPGLRPFFIGIENEIGDLRARARALENKLRG